MDKQHGNSARTCNTDMRHGQLAWISIRDMQQGHAAWTFSVNMHHGPATWTSSMGMQQGHAAWTYTRDMQVKFQIHEACTYLQHGNAELDMKQGHAAWTCTMDIQHGQGHTVIHNTSRSKKIRVHFYI
jgi:hypothetical protein